jgi:hypothetical protein
LVVKDTSMLKIILLSLLLTIPILCACTTINFTAPTPTALATGIEGYVTIGPMCPGPVPAFGTQCPDQPYQATLIILDGDNNQITQIQSDIDGFFRITLEPGTYTIHPVPGKTFPNASDQSVKVMEGEYTRVLIQYDSGIR